MNTLSLTFLRFRSSFFPRDPNRRNLAKKWSIATFTAGALCLANFAAGPIASAQTATRNFAESSLLGAPINVTINATPNGRNWSVTEQIPDGFIAQNISHDGRFVPSRRQIQWGPFPDTTGRNLSFRLVPADLALGSSVVLIPGEEAGLFNDPVLGSVRTPISGRDSFILEGTVFPRRSTTPGDPPPLGPTFTTHPLDQTVGLSRTVTMAATAAGHEPLSFQWFHNGNPIPGATASSRMIKNISRADGGYYFVVVIDAEGRMAVSAPALLTVLDPGAPPPPPIITRHPQDRTAILGRSTSFSVAATGSDPLSFQWFRNGRAINQETSRSLVISDVSESEDGTYHARVTDQRGNATLSHAAVLTVNPLETFTIDRGEHPHLPRIFNLAGSYTDHFAMEGAEARVNYTLAHNQHGRLTGGGNLSFDSPDGNFNTDLQVHGSIRRVGRVEDPIYRVNLTLRPTGEDGFSIVLNQVMEVDANNGRLIGRAHGKAVVNGNTYNLNHEAHQTDLPTNPDGNWLLSITPPMDEETPGQAVLHVQGDERVYEVNHHHLPVQNVEIFHLRDATMDSRGSNIRVDTDASHMNVIRMFGQAKGQHLDATSNP